MQPTMQGGAKVRPLEGVLVVALEQAVAAPYCSSRLADAGARVIKIERPEGDFARGYDAAVHGQSSYFVWLNRGKESIALDLRLEADLAVLHAMLERADVFIQNLAPGASARLGLGAETLRAKHRRLITCDISGYGDQGPYAHMKAYDLLVQAESGLIDVSGAPGQWGRIGVSLVDISTGLNALIGIQQALLARERTGQGSSVKVSLFDSAAELMAVPYLQARYGNSPPQRMGLMHPSIAPYGSFVCSDGRHLVVSIQNEREWQAFCTHVLHNPSLIADERSASNTQRVKHRAWLDAQVAAVFAAHTRTQMVERLTKAQTAFANVNGVNDLVEHPQLRTRPMTMGMQTVDLPATPWKTEWDAFAHAAVPEIDEHGQALRAEFAQRAPPDR